MMINTVGFILNIITLGVSIFTCLISFIITIWILYNLCHNRLKPEDRTIIVLCINIYPLIMIYMIILVIFNIQTLLGDLYESNFNTPWCIFLGFFSPAILTALYWAFVNQAFFRFCCIIYSTYKWLQSFWLYIIIIPIELILSCILISPVLFWHIVAYLPNDYYCYVPVTDIRGILWLFFGVYGIPLIVLSFIYIRITIFLRRQSNIQSLVVKQRQQRDLLVIQRIIITIGFLMILGIPAMVFLIIVFVTGKQHPLTMRIEFIFVSLQMLGLCVLIVGYTPQLKNMILKRVNNNSVYPIQGITVGSIPIKDNTVNQ